MNGTGSKKVKAKSRVMLPESEWSDWEECELEFNWDYCDIGGWSEFECDTIQMSFNSACDTDVNDNGWAVSYLQLDKINRWR
jgi:hypothetical protein